MVYADGPLHLLITCSQIVWFMLIGLFTIPKLWSRRPPIVDEKLALVTVHARHGVLILKERILAKLPPSVTKAL